MTKLESLENEAIAENVEVIDYPFSSNRIKGLYCDGTVALNENIRTNSEKSCVLAEELGHYHTTYGNIICQSSVSNQKQELRARAWAYDKMVGLTGIIDAYKHGCRSTHDTAEYLDVTEEFLQDALKYYRRKYGIHTQIDNYIIYFEPTLGVLNMYSYSHF